MPDTEREVAERIVADELKPLAISYGFEFTNTDLMPMIAAIEAAIATARREQWNAVFDVVSAESYTSVRHLVKALEAEREKQGCGPQLAAAIRAAEGEG